MHILYKTYNIKPWSAKYTLSTIITTLQLINLQ